MEHPALISMVVVSRVCWSESAISSVSSVQMRSIPSIVLRPGRNVKQNLLDTVLSLVYYRRMAKKKMSIGQAMAALRMTRMTPEARREVARNAINTRWDRYRAAKKANAARKGKAA